MKEDINYLEEVAMLYDEFYLVEEHPQISPKETEKIEKAPIFLGGFKSGLLMITSSPSGIPKSDQEMLHNLIVNAIKISWDDVALINLAENTEWSIEKIVTSLKPAKTIIWGCSKELKATPIQIDTYVVSDLLGVQSILVDEIEAFHVDQELKRKLWGSIQSLLKLS